MKQLLHRWTALLCLIGMVGVAYAHEDWNPKADEKAVVTSGNTRFTMLTPQMIRIQYSANGLFEDRATFAVVNRRLPVPQFTSKTENGYLIIETEALKLTYKVGGIIKATDQTTNVLKIEFNMNGHASTWYPGKSDALNLLGTNRTLDTAWGDNVRDQLEKGLLSRAGWVVMDESPATKRGDGSTTYAFEGNSDGYDWVAPTVDASAIDWYFMGYGHEYKKALYDFTRIAGKVPLPPKYIFGYWYSRYWAYSANDFKQIISDVETNQIPMDVLIMDMDWHKSGWTGWSWNTSKIPDPKGLIQHMHDHGLKTALNLHPSDGISSHETQYKTLRSDLGLPSTSTANIPWRIHNYTFSKNFFKDIIRPLEADGVDFWWLDWQQERTIGEHAKAKGYDAEGVDGLSETFWCNHTFFQDMEKNRKELRPVIYHRWGGMGSHRYPICFSGDTWAAWSTLGYEIFFTSNASNVCYTYWGHDLGGHQGGGPGGNNYNDPELLLRWLQFGAYTPIFRTHATNDSKLERRIWKYSNKAKLIEAVRLRYRLIPYLYTAARETYDTGVGMNRPLYYDYPEDPNAYLYEDEYMYGNDMLVAPIYSPAENGYSTRNIWLPEGSWYDVTQSKLVPGSRLFSAKFTLDEFPVFYKGGSIIPLFNVTKATRTTKTPAIIQLMVVPGADGEGNMYEDEGDNQNYLQGQFTNTHFTQQYSETQTVLTIEGRKGSFNGMSTIRTYKATFLGVGTPKMVTVNGETTTNYTYDSNTQTLTISVEPTSLAQSTTIKVEHEGVKSDSNMHEDLGWDEDGETIIAKMPQGGLLGTLTIYDMSGRQVGESRATDAQSLSVSLAGLKRGTYVCRFAYGNKVITKKINK